MPPLLPSWGDWPHPDSIVNKTKMDQINTAIGLTYPAAGAVTSAATTTLPTDSNLIVVTTGVNIANITASWPGRVVTLLFLSGMQVTDGGNLKLASNFNTSVNGTLTLICDGTNWYEMCRSVNL